jgi:DNA polymerase III subunit epsilon
MREIVLDTGTIGLDPEAGHRMVEIGPVELVNCSLTGQTFHRYLCPQRAMPADALAMHELTAEFLADKPLLVRSPTSVRRRCAACRAQRGL